MYILYVYTDTDHEDDQDVQIRQFNRGATAKGARHFGGRRNARARGPWPICSGARRGSTEAHRSDRHCRFGAWAETGEKTECNAPGRGLGREAPEAWLIPTSCSTPTYSFICSRTGQDRCALVWSNASQALW